MQMKIVEIILLMFLLGCAIAVTITKNLMSSVVIFMNFSAIMSILWLFLKAPDLAITEAAVGVGVTSILLFVTLLKIDKLKDEEDELIEMGNDTHEEN